MNKNILVKLFGFSATLFNWDTLVYDRWQWLSKHIPVTNKPKKLLDVGCGTGAFSIGMGLRGYETLGLSWDERNQNVATQRASICNSNAKFEILDVRFLDKRTDLYGQFDYIICTENIEHIINDQKLMIDMSKCLKKDGLLLLTTPNFDYVPIGIGDAKEIPNPPVEDGSHVVIGYTPDDFKRLCKNSSLEILDIGYCSGFFSQKITFILRLFAKIHPIVGWIMILPLRILPILFDKYISYEGYSITLIAKKS